jgi:hypothetical protein
MQRSDTGRLSVPPTLRVFSLLEAISYTPGSSVTSENLLLRSATIDFHFDHLLVSHRVRQANKIDDSGP